MKLRPYTIIILIFSGWCYAGAGRYINDASVPALFEAKGIMVGVVLVADNESGSNTTVLQVNHATGETFERINMLSGTSALYQNVQIRFFNNCKQPSFLRQIPEPLHDLGTRYQCDFPL